MRLMRSIFMAIALAAIGISTATAQTPRTPGELLERVAGTWVLEGTMDGKKVTHDVVAISVLNGRYLQLHETSREKDAQGRPAYEAFVYLTWEPSHGEYSCQWLDSTSNAGLSNGVTCRARPADDEIPLVFKYTDGNRFHTSVRVRSEGRHVAVEDGRERKGETRPVRARDAASGVRMRKSGSAASGFRAAPAAR